MKYDKIVEAFFIERPNRFIARVKIDGAEEVELVHVKNTGRCRELLLPGAEVILEDCIEKNPNRKTRYDLIADMSLSSRSFLMHRILLTAQV